MTDPDGPAAASTGPEGAAAPAADLTERVVDSRVVHKGHYMEFRVDTIERADGTRGERDIVGHPGAVAMLAIDEADRVLMVRQFRLAAGDVLLEIPAGTLDVDPATGAVEDPEIAVAARARGGDRLPGPDVAEARLVLDRAGLCHGAHAPLPRDGPRAGGRRTAGPGRGRAPRARASAVRGSPGGRRPRRDPRREVARRPALATTGCGAVRRARPDSHPRTRRLDLRARFPGVSTGDR